MNTTAGTQRSQDRVKVFQLEEVEDLPYPKGGGSVTWILFFLKQVFLPSYCPDSSSMVAQKSGGRQEQKKLVNRK
jgi:hypothetical protein